MDTLTKSCSPATVITANGEVQTHEEATVYVKELDFLLTMKVLEKTPAVLSIGKLCDENGYSYEWINGQNTHLIKDGIRIICNTENFVPIVVPGLSSSSSGSSSTSRTESHSSSSSSTSTSSPTVSVTKTREPEDRIESDISPVTVSTTVDERSGRPDIDQANKKSKTRSFCARAASICRRWAQSSMYTALTSPMTSAAIPSCQWYDPETCLTEARTLGLKLISRFQYQPHADSIEPSLGDARTNYLYRPAWRRSSVQVETVSVGSNCNLHRLWLSQDHVT